MAKVYLTTCDPVHIYVYNESECNETFGDEMLDEYGTEIPTELLERYTKAYYEFWSIQDELKNIRKGK